MTRHSKVFVPVSEPTLQPFEEIKILSFYEEKENVYVLTEDELKELLRHYGSFLSDIRPLSSLTESERDFLQSKTNPQTENK